MGLVVVVTVTDATVLAREGISIRLPHFYALPRKLTT